MENNNIECEIIEITVLIKEPESNYIKAVRHTAPDAEVLFTVIFMRVFIVIWLAIYIPIRIKVNRMNNMSSYQ
jgi:hypothetical protein